MLLQELLDINEEIYLIEENYLAQRKIESTLQYLNGLRKFSGEHEMRLLRVCENERTLGLLLFNAADENVPVDFWSVFTGSFASANLRKEFEEIVDVIFSSNAPVKEIETPFERWQDAVIEYYSLMLVTRNLCPICNVRPESYKNIFSESRVQKVEAIFGYLKKRDLYPKGKVLEVCCGNGMSTLALYRLGLTPLAVEINKCTVCQGLEQGVLNPQKTIIMDATALSKYFEPGSFDVVMGFMLGLIYEFNKELWTSIMREAVQVANDNALLLFTVSSKPEIEILAAALSREGVEGEIVDNTDSEGTYDQWLFVGKKKIPGSQA